MHESRNTDVVLLVDDVPDNLAVLADMLEQGGYSVLIANSGERALESARRTAPDAILLDALMPGMDGFETCRQLKKDALTRDVPVIFMTGLTETEHVLAGFASGGIDYVTKPVRPEIVLARLAAHMRSARSTLRALDALDASGVGAIVLDDNFTLVWQTPRSKQHLIEFFPQWDSESELPLVLGTWLSACASDAATVQQLELPHPIMGGRNLRLRLYKGASGDESMLLVDRHAPSAAGAKQEINYHLTPREWDVLKWVAKGKTNRDIGDILSLSPRTVNKHLEHIYEKLGVETRTAAAAMAMRFATNAETIEAGRS